MRVRVSTGRGGSHHSVESDHWSQVRRRGDSPSYEVLALAVCEDAYLIASQWERQPVRVKRELRSWIFLRSSECSLADPRSRFCLDVICEHFGWDLQAVRGSYLDATTGPLIEGRRTLVGPS